MLEAVPGQSLYIFVGISKPGEVVGLPPGDYGGF
jgi:hypothetical protein